MTCTEQERLIQTLAAQNTSGNTQFRLVLLALPLVTTLPYLIHLFRPSTALLSLLSLTSLLSTAYLLYKLPPETTGIDPLDRWSRPRTPQQSSRELDPTASQRRPTSFSMGQHKSPLELHLPYLNIGLCVVLILMGLLTRSDEEERFGMIGLGNLPAVVCGVVLAAKMVMNSVDPEKELGVLKYEYKGA